MATSGTIGSLSEPNQSTTTNNGYIDAMIDWSATQSIEGNYSDVTATLKYSRNNTGYTTYGRWTGSITINGTTKTVSSASDRITITYNSNTVAVSNTVRVYHDNDGTKSITISATGKLAGTSLESTSISGTVTLTTIPRASAISSLTSSVAINGSNTVSVNISRHSSSFTHTVRFYINSTYTKTISDVGTSTSYAIPTTWLSAMPSSTSCTAYCVVTTYNGSTPIGDSVSKTFTVTVPSSVVPSIDTITLDPANITTADGTSRNILVKGKNKLTVSVSGCAAGTGSSIKSYTFSGQNLSSTISSTAASASATSNVISSIGSLTYTVKITDARGRTASKTATITCYDYDTPTFKSFTAYRCNLDGTANDNGTYIKYSFAVDYSSVNSTNKSTVAIYYKQNANNSWTSAANALTSSTTKTADDIVKDSSGTEIVFNADTTYAIYATVVDNYSGSTNSSTITVFGASRVLNIRANGTGVAFGKMAETDHLFESKWPLKIDDEIKFGSGVQGRLYTDETDGKNIVYIQTGQSIIGGTTMGLAIHAGSQGSETDVSSPSVYVENSANSGLVNLGSNGRKWNQLYAVNDTIATSDRNVKTDIANMTYTQEQLFNKLQPVTFKFINGTSGRTHYGFVSQDVEGSLNELALTGKDFAGFCKDLRVNDDGSPVLDENGNKIYDYALRYSEFIALNTYMIQKLQNEIVELKAEIAELKSTTQN